jgi:hypothetical protein
MALIIPEGYAQVLIPIKHSLLNRSAAVTFGIRNDQIGTPTTGTVNDIQAEFVPAINLDNNVVVGPTLARFGTDTGEALAIEGTVSTSGSSTSSSCPPNVAVLARKLTNRGGRRGRGRMFIPWWVDEASVDEAGNIAGATVTSFQSALSNFLAGLSAADLPMFILHDSIGGTPAGDPDQVQSLICDPLVATQRRRLRS